MLPVKHTNYGSTSVKIFWGLRLNNSRFCRAFFSKFLKLIGAIIKAKAANTTAAPNTTMGLRNKNHCNTANIAAIIMKMMIGIFMTATFEGLKGFAYGKPSMKKHASPR